MITEKLRRNYLAVTGILLPYAAILLIVSVVSLLPYDTADKKWERIGELAILLPLAASFFGTILIGVNSVIRDIQTGSERGRMNSFLFSFLWSAVFHYFVTIYFFMQTIYARFGWLKP